MSGKSRGAEHFENLYAANPDPWNFATSDYERDKYAATIRILGERRFDAGFEAGCSIGILTRLLAARCQNLLAADIVPDAVAQAAKRCADLPGVTCRAMTIPDEWPAENFDLIVFSEILYFFCAADIRLIAARCLASLRPGGLALLVNFTDPTGDDPSSGHEAAEIFIAAAIARSRVVAQHREDKFRIDVLELL